VAIGLNQVQAGIETGDGQDTLDRRRKGEQLQLASGLPKAAARSHENVQTGRGEKRHPGGVHAELPVPRAEKVGQQPLEARGGEQIKLTDDQHTTAGNIAEHGQLQSIRPRVAAIHSRSNVPHTLPPWPRSGAAQRDHGPRPPRQRLRLMAVGPT
jgi:hypothetical protein